MSKLLRRLGYWIRRRRMERELVEEIEFHRTLKQQALEQSGLSSEHARTPEAATSSGWSFGAP
jgi:hypothetical protein